jgi:hypothetical protein
LTRKKLKKKKKIEFENKSILKKKIHIKKSFFKQTKTKKTKKKRKKATKPVIVSGRFFCGISIFGAEIGKISSPAGSRILGSGSKLHF